MIGDPLALLRRHLGYPAFRPGQEALVRALLQGRDALGVLPTGGGKSVCYQVPALALEGVAVVITPLVSLMEDQVRRARAAGLRAAYLSAAQPGPEKAEALRAMVAGELDLVFVAPERLELDSFRRHLGRARVSFVAVDEAHCISEWGEDFRPSYRRIGAIRRQVRCPFLALTATATPRVRDEIRTSLGLCRPETVILSFDRPNLAWSVRAARGWTDRVRILHGLLRRTSGTSLVYAGTRRQVETLRDALAGLGLPSEAYHAGLPGVERTRVQEVFLDGVCRVVVATNAFGMGIDKADVRLVAHLQLPTTLEAYYQEAGRAGRDGGAATCVALHHPADTALGHAFVDRTHPPSRVLRRAHRRLRALADERGVVEGTAAEWARVLGPAWSPADVPPLVEALARARGVRIRSGAGERGAQARPPPEEAGTWRVYVSSSPDFSRTARLRRAALGKLGSVRRYAETRGCRRRALLGYFGEDAPGECGACDRCCLRRAG